MGEAPQFWQVIILVSVSDKYSICSVLVTSIVSAIVSQSCVEQTNIGYQKLLVENTSLLQKQLWV